MKTEKENLFVWIMRIFFIFTIIFSVFVIFSAIAKAESVECLTSKNCDQFQIHLVNRTNGDVLGATIPISFYFPKDNSTSYNTSFMNELTRGEYKAIVNATVLGEHSFYWNTTSVYCLNCSGAGSFMVVEQYSNTTLINISDYSKIINDTASKIEKNVSNINSWNNAIIKSNIQIYGTEYTYNENATIYVQVTNSTGQSVNTSNCNITIYYPKNLTIFKNESMNNTRGFYNYNFITPYTEGDFPIIINCLNPEAVGISKIHIGKWANSIMVGLNNTLSLFDCNTITGNNDVCDRLNKIIDTANDTLFYAKLSTPSYLMNIYKIDSNEVGYPYAYRLELSPRGNPDPTIFLKVPVNSSSDLVLRNDLLNVNEFTLTQDILGENWITFKTTGLGCDKIDLDSHLECMFKNYYVYLRNPLYLKNDTVADLKPQSYLDITLERFSTAEKKMIPNYNFDGYLIFSLIVFGVIIFFLIIIFALACDRVKIQQD